MLMSLIVRNRKPSLSPTSNEGEVGGARLEESSEPKLPVSILCQLGVFHQLWLPHHEAQKDRVIVSTDYQWTASEGIQAGFLG